MTNKLFISEIGLEDGSVFDDLIFDGTLQELEHKINETCDPIILTLQENSQKLFIRDVCSITYFIFKGNAVESEPKKAQEKIKTETSKENFKDIEAVIKWLNSSKEDFDFTRNFFHR